MPPRSRDQLARWIFSLFPLFVTVPYKHDSNPQVVITVTSNKSLLRYCTTTTGRLMLTPYSGWIHLNEPRRPYAVETRHPCASKAVNLHICTWAEITRKTPNLLSHPGAQRSTFLRELSEFNYLSACFFWCDDWKRCGRKSGFLGK